MSFKKKISALLLIASSAFAVVTLTGTSNAIGEGQIAGGDIYRVRNLTKNTAYSDPASATKCETVQYKVRMHNPGPGDVNNVNVKVSLPSAVTTRNVSTATITSQNSQPSTVSDTATLNLNPALGLNYISGSTQLLDTNSNPISNLPDGITGGGVNIGKVGVSLKNIKFVQFKAKTECKETPPPPPPHKNFKCKALNVATVDNKKFKFTAVAEVENVTVQSYNFTAKKDGSTVDQKTVTTNALTADYEFTPNSPGTYLVNVVINTSAGSTKPEDCQKKIVIKKDVPPPPKKKFKCESLSAKMVDRYKYNLTAKAYVENTEVQSYVFTVKRDGTTVDQKTITTNAKSADYQFNQTAEGTYIVTAVVNTKAGSTKPEDCAKQIVVTKKDVPPPPPVTPPNYPEQPPTYEVPGEVVSEVAPAPEGTPLPDTGPGQVAALALGVSVISGMAYSLITRRFN